MFSFRQKIFASYAVVFLTFIVLMFPFVNAWVHHIVISNMEDRATEIISYIKDAPNHDALIRRLKDQKSLILFRLSIIDDQRKVLYDTHVKRKLGPKFTQDYVVSHPEVMQALEEGAGYHEEFSELLQRKFAYYAKTFDFNGHTYILRTAFPYQYVQEITKDFTIGFLGIAMATLIMFSLMTWFVIYHLTQPIQTIIKSVKLYQGGVQTTLPAIDVSNMNPRDDFTQLALTLNSLSSKIQSHIDILTHERNEKEAILESLGEGVIAVDVNMEIAYANQLAAKLINCNRTDLIGHQFTELHQDNCFSLLQRCQQEDKVLTDTLQLYNEGKKFYLDIVAAPKRDHQGAILVLQDKTSHYKIFDMRRDFIANASHELKTPITIIRGFAEALHDNPGLPRETQEEITGKIVRNTIRMGALIKDLLTLADIENIPSSRLVLCDIHLLAETCCSMLSEVFPEAQVNIELHKKEIKMIADADLLELAVFNLIENAAKYSPRPAHITITLDQIDDQVMISVADKGMGIPAADQEHIFDRFYTVDKAHSQKMGGSGLGLSIVKTIVEKHFGTITLQSEIKKGSTFTILLPTEKTRL
jgi:two-component system, OmpR family, phosphate regulon sensor histidine kinase PhoR